MGGGTLWKSVARAVGVAAPAALASNAALCSACTATPSPRSSPRAASCTCKANAVQSVAALKFGSRQFRDFDDWEFAGDEERDHYVFGSLPTVKEVEEASAELRNALSLGFLTPPVLETEALPVSGPSIVEVTDFEPSVVTTIGDDETSANSGPSALEVTADTELSNVTTVGDGEGEVNSPLSPLFTKPDWIEPPALDLATTPKEHGAPSNAMLEAFHEFQHNPQVQGMVVSLATDKGVWDAVLANQKIQEFRQGFNGFEGSPQVGLKQKKKRSGKNFNIFSRVFWSTKKAFSNFLQSFQDFMTSLFEAADKKELGNEKTNVFERSVKACMMLAMVVLSIVVFKRSAAAKRG
jgi:hypothetical protein